MLHLSNSALVLLMTNIVSCEENDISLSYPKTTREALVMVIKGTWKQWYHLSSIV